MPLFVNNDYSPTIKSSCDLFYLDIYLSESPARSSPREDKTSLKKAFINLNIPIYPM